MRNLILSALLLASAFQAALGQIVEGQWTYIVENGGATITASTARGAVTIPSQLGGYPVLKVGNSYPPVFGAYNTTVTSLVIPSSVTSIGILAFYGCESLPSVTIPNSVTSIEGGAFGDCRSLANITIPDSVTTIRNGAFNYCINLTSITIGNNVVSIGDYTFEDCYSLTSLIIPRNVMSIGNDAFKTCTNLGLVTLSARFATTYTNFGLTASQVSFYDESSSSYLMGQQSVIANPNSYGLYTTSQIQNMAVDDLVLTKNGAGTFTLNYDIEQSSDLQTWTTYAPLSLPLTGLPTDKAFVRIKAKK